jgi:hypothetical protein
MKKGAFAFLSFFMASALPVLANPVTNSSSILLTPIALIAETLVVSTLLSRRGFRYSSVFGLWFFITLVTSGVMNLAIFMWGFGVFEADNLPFLKPLFVFEAVVVLVEAGIIMLMSKSKSLRNPGTPFTWKSALMISLIGNLVSFGISLIAYFIPAHGGPPPTYH